jgi:hypothetical protein
MFGNDGCLFIYGQTGSDKTFTLMGGAGTEGQGIIPRTIKMILCEKEKLQKQVCHLYKLW